MRQSITTRYVGPTNSRGSRIKAIARKRDGIGPELSATVPYGHGNTEEEHCKGAKACAEKLGWSGLWIGGGNLDENGYVFVNVGFHVSDIMRCKGNLGTEGRDWFYIERTDRI